VRTAYELLTATIIFTTILVVGGLILSLIIDDQGKAYMISFAVAIPLGGWIFIKLHKKP